MSASWHGLVLTLTAISRLSIFAFLGHSSVGLARQAAATTKPIQRGPTNLAYVAVGSVPRDVQYPGRALDRHMPPVSEEK